MQLSKLFKKNRGFTLVELMIVVAIIGVLAALAVYGVSKNIRSAKTAEARNSLGAIGKAAIASYSAEGMSGAVLAEGKAAGFSNALCNTAAATVPAAIASVKGQKYQSTVAEWNNATDKGTATTRAKGFVCLKFTMDQPQYYMYGYKAANVGTGTDTMTATANGDLNGDGVTSSFTLLGAVEKGRVKLAPAITEIDAEE